jgi:hypothetical protein
MPKPKKKATSKPPKRHRGRAPEPYTVQELRDAGSSVFTFSKQDKRAIGACLGASVGAAIGLYAAEYPDVVERIVVKYLPGINDMVKKAAADAGVPGYKTAPSPNTWLKDKPAVMWLRVHQSALVAHAFPMILDAEPMTCACGLVMNNEHGLVPDKPPTRKCDLCKSVLLEAGYDASTIDATKPSAARQPSPTASSRPGKRSRKPKMDA